MVSASFVIQRSYSRTARFSAFIPDFWPLKITLHHVVLRNQSRRTTVYQPQIWIRSGINRILVRLTNSLYYNDTMKDTTYRFPYKHEGRQLKFDEARTQVDEYRKTAHTGEVVFAEAFSKNVLMEMLRDDDCQGIRIYHGRQDGTPTLLLVGIDHKGNDMHRTQRGLKDMGGDDGSNIYGDGTKCPDQCGE